MHNKLFNSLIPCILLSLGIMGCNKDITSDSAQTAAEQGFTLTAEYGDPATRAAFDEDGLGLTWEPGDKLYLVDVAGNNATVEMEATITEPSKSASFYCDKSVLSGDYIVMFGHSSKSEKSLDISMTDLASLKNRVVLYGSLTVTDGQTSANIILNHAYAKLTFKFQNIPTGLKNICCGMAITKDGMPSNNLCISATGVTPTGSDVFMHAFSWTGDTNSYVLIPPFNSSGSKVYFYLYGTDANNNHVTYEIVKDGIDIQAGNNYNLTLDFSTATSCTITNNELSTPAQFRAAAYWSSANSYKVTADVDFADEAYFPIYCNEFNGNGHTLSNITIDLANCEKVGIISQATDAIQKVNATNLSVIGGKYTGGLCGYAYPYSYTNISSSVIKGSVSSSKDYIGGIVGITGGKVSQCGFEGTVTSTGKYVGGIVGKHDSSGSSYPITECYVNGTVNSSATGSDAYVGGIVGYSYRSLVNNSYFIGETSGSGISGYNFDFYYYYCINNCYSYGTIESYGISDRYIEYSKYLTSASSLASDYGGANTPYCNLGANKTFLSNINIINGDEKYSTQCWPDIDAMCPLLQWQAKGFGGDIDIPGFGDQTWN